MGDVLVCDNATAHVGEDTFGTILAGFEQLAIQLILLPQYSPEFNYPAELCFAFLKNRLRSHHRDVPLVDDIVKHLSQLKRKKLYRCTDIAK